MSEGIVNEMNGESNDELTARVIIDGNLVRRSSDRALLNKLNFEEVLIHRETAQAVPATKSIRVKVSLKNNPSLTSYILSKFLDPLTEKTREFLSEKNII